MFHTFDFKIFVLLHVLANIDISKDVKRIVIGGSFGIPLWRSQQCICWTKTQRIIVFWSSKKTPHGRRPNIVFLRSVHANINIFYDLLMAKLFKLTIISLNRCWSPSSILGHGPKINLGL